MADFSGVYDETRRRLCEFVSSLTAADQHRPVPATPGWTVHDVVAHLTGDLEAVQADNLPSSFFAALGDQEEVAKLNAWTGRMVEERRDRPTPDVLSEWEQRTALAMEMLRGEQPLPSGWPSFGNRVLISDIGVHEQDIYGAFGVVRERDCSAVRIATSLYVAGMGSRLNGRHPVRFETDKKTYQAGEGEPGATARTTRFELFRALSGPAQSGPDSGLGVVGRPGVVPEPVLRLRPSRRGPRRAVTHCPRRRGLVRSTSRRRL